MSSRLADLSCRHQYQRSLRHRCCALKPPADRKATEANVVSFTSRPCMPSLLQRQPRGQPGPSWLAGCSLKILSHIFCTFVALSVALLSKRGA